MNDTQNEKIEQVTNTTLVSDAFGVPCGVWNSEHIFV